MTTLDPHGEHGLAGHRDPAGPAEPAEPEVADVGGVPMSAIVRRVPNPRAVVVALHGGAASARYFHHPGAPRLSLLDTGAALGFTVVALDRPGYGSSAELAATARPEERVDLVYQAVDRLVPGAERGAGLFVVGHSAGCELAVRLAADPRGADLLGVELSGTGTRHHPAAAGLVDTTSEQRLMPRPMLLYELLWRPERLYPAEVIGGLHFASGSPAYEGEVVANWARRDFASVAERVRVPVRYTLAEHEKVWSTDSHDMAAVAGLFTASPRVVTHRQLGGGHNLSVSHAAMAYHLGVLAFLEECVTANENDPTE